MVPHMASAARWADPNASDDGVTIFIFHIIVVNGFDDVMIKILTVVNDTLYYVLFVTNRTFCLSTETVATTTTTIIIIIVSRKIKTTYNLENHTRL